MPVRQVPLFPLPRCVFFPAALLPLHMFEPRYRAMMDHIVDQLPDDRFIAIAMLADGYEPTYDTLAAPIHSTVTVGRVVEHARLEDGRYNLLVHGLWRGRVTQEDRSGPFRVAEVELIAADPDAASLEAGAVAKLDAVLKQAIQRGAVDEEVVNAIIGASRQGDELIDLLAFNLLSSDDSPAKQRMLEEQDVHQRCQQFITTLQKAIATRSQATASQGPESSEGWSPTALN